MLTSDLYLQVNRARLEDRITALAQIGAHGAELGAGITRRALSPEEDSAKEFIRACCTVEGIPTRQDGAGNLIARIGPHGPAVVTGSHLDTVPRGGHLDGAYGVIAGLEALCCLKEREAELTRAVELVAFTDEEGRFGAMVGSKCMSGDMDEQTLREARDESGRSLADAFKERGLSIEGALEARREPSEVERFIELHIEQGPVLETQGAEIGVVEEIVGIVRWRAVFRGEANHAGTTPMELRRDAFMGLTSFAQRLAELTKEHGSPAARVTIGEVNLSPGYMGVIPEEAHFTLDLRDIDQGRLEATNSALRALASAVATERQLSLEIEEVGHLHPTQCDSRSSHAPAPKWRDP